MANIQSSKPGASLRMIDLFAGAGGLSSGFQRAGFEVVAGSDHDPDAMATFAANFPNATAIVGDIRQQDVQSKVIDAGTGVDVIVGGPPCQAFSQVRNHSRLIDDPRNSLYKEFVNIVGQIEPPAFVMENVQGMAQMGVKEQVIADLSQGGRYSVSAKVLDAADFGVPQTRKRLIFVGIHRDLKSGPPVLEGTGASVALALMRDSVERGGYRLGLRNDVVAEELLHRLVDPNDAGVVSSEQAIGDLDFLGVGAPNVDRQLADFPRATSAYQRAMRTATVVSNLGVPRMNADTTLRLNGIPAGGNYLDLDETLRGRYLTGQKWGPSTGSKFLERKHYYAYRRLHPDLWAWTLNTKADAVYHYRSARALSVREFSRLQSFSDDFVVTVDPRPGVIEGRVPNGATHSKYRQIGNAVPPLLGAAVARAVAEIVSSHTSVSA